MKPLVFQGRYTLLDGAVLVALLGLFTLMLLRRERRSPNQAEDRLPHEPGGAVFHVVLIILGLLALFYGGRWLVSGSYGVAKAFGMPESLIGATIIAVGTSLPELATAMVAARRGHPEIAVGNVVGSNIFNICMVLGICSLVRPLPVAFAEHGLRMCLGLVLAIALGILFMRRTQISRRAGGILLVCYLAYLTVEVARL
jgi:cation:H+ antiporter